MASPEIISGPAILSCTDSDLSITGNVIGILTFAYALLVGAIYYTRITRDAPQRWARVQKSIQEAEFYIDLFDVDEDEARHIFNVPDEQFEKEDVENGGDSVGDVKGAEEDVKGVGEDVKGAEESKADVSGAINDMSEKDDEAERENREKHRKLAAYHTWMYHYNVWMADCHHQLADLCEEVETVENAVWWQFWRVLRSSTQSSKAKEIDSRLKYLDATTQKLKWLKDDLELRIRDKERLDQNAVLVKIWTLLAKKDSSTAEDMNGNASQLDEGQMLNDIDQKMIDALMKPRRLQTLLIHGPSLAVHPGKKRSKKNAPADKDSV